MYTGRQAPVALIFHVVLITNILNTTRILPVDTALLRTYRSITRYQINLLFENTCMDWLPKLDSLNGCFKGTIPYFYFFFLLHWKFLKISGPGPGTSGFFESY